MNLRPNEIYYIDEEYIDGLTPEKARLFAEAINGTVPVNKGIALLPIIGPTGNCFDGWNLSYSQLKTELEELVSNDGIHTIVMLINSPGGEATGMLSFCEDVRNACGKKRIVSLISGMGCSAGYAIACSASKVCIEPDAITGSCGTYAECTAEDPEAMRKNYGIISRIFRSYNAPKKNQSPATDKEAAEALQKRIDKCGSNYFDFVSKCRGIEKKKCEETFGEGATVEAGYALEAGMVDEVITYKELISSLSASDKEETAEGSEGADMDIEKMSAEERQELFLNLTNANPELLASVTEKASKEERERVMQMTALLNGNAGHDAIVRNAIEGKKDINSLKCELFDYMQSEPEKKAEDEKQSMAINAKALEMLADADQQISPATIDAAEARYQQIMNQVKEARK